MNFLENNTKTPKDLMDFLSKNMRYGFTYRNKTFTEDEKDFQANMNKLYKLRLGDDFVKNKYGVCWDFCEFERAFFEEAKIPHECYFYISFLNREKSGPTHTFLLFYQNNKWHWFEYSWQKYRGIWEYETKKDALKDILEKFINYYNRNIQNVEIYRTKKVRSRLDAYNFIEHCLNGEKITLN